jgi:hypothetical protein
VRGKSTPRQADARTDRAPIRDARLAGLEPKDAAVPGGDAYAAANI